MARAESSAPWSEGEGNHSRLCSWIGGRNVLADSIEIYPLTPDRWDDLAALFGRSGAMMGCWCMYWRMTSSDFSHTSSQQHREGFETLVRSGATAGLLAYVDGQPAGWCSVAPRSSYPRLAHSRTLTQLDDQPVWSIVCFFIKPSYRGQGLAAGLLQAAIGYGRQQGVPTLEAYPLDTAHAQIPDASAYMGTLDLYLSAGFHIARRIEAKGNARPRCIVRYDLTGSG
jgi:GNAT superfamily N-acetyltransferase